ncbi:Hydrophobic W protein OS=Streptomyces fumanus OX=67302 GN=GCM10018772_05510 PE=4 SV=1 [Streptomyces fumanus]
MSRDEEKDDPIAMNENAVPGDPEDISQRAPLAGASGPAPHLSVVIGADGSASVDGVPVRVEQGQSLDEAVLDALHRHARERGTPVTAAISDPASAHVTFVEVAADGSSRLVEEPAGSSQAAPAPPVPVETADGAAVGPAEPHEAYGHPGDTAEIGPPGIGAPSQAGLDGNPGDLDGADGLDGLDDNLDVPDDLDGSPGRLDDVDAGPDDLDYLDADPGDGLGDDPSSARPRPSFARPSLPSLPSLPRPSLPSFSSRVPSLSLPRRSKDAGASAGSRQSDDEYRAPGLLHRPLVVGPVALGVTALVVLPLVLLGGGSDDGGKQNEAAGASDKLSSPPAQHSPTASASPTVSVSPRLSALPSPSSTAKKKKSEPKKDPKPKKTPHADSAGGGAGTVVRPPNATVTVRPPKATVTVRPPKATKTVTAKPPAETAATAVNQLAKKNPGRHVCYRAYVSGRGWQKPVCDGAAAGTPGGKTTRHAGLRHQRRHRPGLRGFPGAQRRLEPAALCGARPEYIFGGTLSNDRWLEGVGFVV